MAANHASLRKWRSCLPRHLPTDSIKCFPRHDVLAEQVAFEYLRAPNRMGQKYALLADKGLISVAAEGYCQAPSVAVYYTTDDAIQNGKKNLLNKACRRRRRAVAVRRASRLQTFHGAVGIDKLNDVDGMVARFETALTEVLAKG